jgi:Protease inhibitor Inh
MTRDGFADWRRAIIGAAVAGGICGSALAEEPPATGGSGDTMIGNWEFSNADRDKVCRFTFRGEASAGGYKVDIDRNCAGLFPLTKDIVGWSLDTYGTLRLLDGSGNTVIELSEAETGIFDGFQPGEGRYVLQSAAAPPEHSAEDLIGDWAITRGAGKAICVLTLVNTPSGADKLSLKVQPGCDPFVLRFGPTFWKIDRGDLVLLSARGQIWRFEEDDANTWLRVPAPADPILLVRQH